MYTKEGNWDLVGNNIPVFFIQDAIKFPDLIHAVKMEPDRGFPQAASAHDTFWDFIALTPEAMHMVMWQMSDRTLPRSLRMIEGFGVHSFRLLDDADQSTFVKFHWRPKLGLQSTVWEEAVKIAGADPDFHRRDLFESITSGSFPEWELGVQLFTEQEADAFPFDHLDSTKLIPEELVPLKIVGRMVLDRWPDNFFAETEQVAYCSSHAVPGIDFSNDPLLAGRLHSYLDTQLSRLGSPNFQQIPVNAPQCPFSNQQRDGHMQMQRPKGRVAYEPSSLDPMSARASPSHGFRSFAAPENGSKGRIRAESFADHYSQARQFFRSQTPPEQARIASALVFELSKVETVHVREGVVGQLRQVDETLAQRVAAGLAMDALPPPAATRTPAENRDPSPRAAAHRQDEGHPRRSRGRHPDRRRVGCSTCRLGPRGSDSGRCKSEDRRTEGWWSEALRRHQAAGPGPACRHAIGDVRRGRGDSLGGRRGNAVQGSGSSRFRARCVRSPQGDRDRCGRPASGPAGRNRAR